MKFALRWSTVLLVAAVVLPTWAQSPSWPSHPRYRYAGVKLE